MDGEPNSTLDLRVQYFACDDALTFCIPVRQDYKVSLAREDSNSWSIRMNPDGTRAPGGGMGMGMGMAAGMGAAGF